MFHPGTQPKELRLDRRFDSEYMSTYRPLNQEYVSRIKSLYGTAKFPQVCGGEGTGCGGPIHQDRINIYIYIYE